MDRTHLVSPTSAWMTPGEAAAHLGVRPKTLEFWRLTGGGPRYAKLGRFVRYRSDWCDAWAETRAVHSTAEARRMVIR